MPSPKGEAICRPHTHATIFSKGVSPHAHPPQKRFLDLPISQKFVSIFAVMTLLSCAVMVGALHLGLSVFEEKLYEKSLRELDFFVQSIDDDLQQMDVLTRSIAVDTTIQSQLAQLTAADPETAQYYYLLTGVRPLLLEKLYMSGQADALQFVDLNGNAIVVGQSFPDPGEERRIQLADALNRAPPAALPCCRRMPITPILSAGAMCCAARI